MIPWFKSVLDGVIEAGVELANEIEPEYVGDSDVDNMTEEETQKERVKRERSKSTPNHSSFLSATRNAMKDSPVPRKNVFEGAEPLDLGVTPLLIEYVINLCQHPDTWINFPVEEVLLQKTIKAGRPIPQEPIKDEDHPDYVLTDKEEAHAIAVLKEIEQLNELRYKLVPRSLSDERFWRVYFLLISNKFQLSDSDESFRMPQLQSSEDSLSHNSFYSAYGCSNKQTDRNTFSFLQNGSATLSIIHVDDGNEGNIQFWQVNQKGSRSSEYASTLCHESHGHQGETSNWGKIDPYLLKQDRPKIYKLLLRCGVPDDYRYRAWKASPAVSICVESLPSTPRKLLRKNTPPTPIKSEFFYSKFLENAFGKEVPVWCTPVPTFGGNVPDYQSHFLSKNGIQAFRRILILLALNKPEVHNAPVLLHFVPLLISFMSEENAYHVCSVIVDESIVRCHYIPLGHRHQELFGLTFASLLEKFMPQIYKHLVALSVCVKTLFIRWATSLFVGILPYQTVLRCLDCLLYEGSVVLYRIALGILSKCRIKILACKTGKSVREVLERSAKSELVADALFLESWKFKVKHEHLVALYSSIVEEGKLKEICEHEMENFHFPVVQKPSAIASTQQFESIWTWIPQRYRLCELVPIFDSTIDGCSLKTLISKCSDFVPSLLLVKTQSQQTFGVFLAQTWTPQDHYFGSGESFLFSLSPTIIKYPWYEGENHCIMLLSFNQVAFGGGNEGDGLRLDEELWHGQSYRSETFKNEPLHGEDDPEFKCVHVEVFIFE